MRPDGTEQPAACSPAPRGPAQEPQRGATVCSALQKFGFWLKKKTMSGLYFVRRLEEEEEEVAAEVGAAEGGRAVPCRAGPAWAALRDTKTFLLNSEFGSEFGP